MNCLFWNTYLNPNINPILADLISEYKCDVVVLAEYKADINDLLHTLESKGVNMYAIPQAICKRIHIITKYTPDKIEHFTDSYKYTIKKIPHETLESVFLVCVHLPSKKHSDNHTHVVELTHLSHDIRDIEIETGIDRTIVVGDFNMNPFEESMVSASGMHALGSKIEAKKISRIVQSRRYYKFYNPMWNLLGDFNGLPGSYYYSSSSYINYFWHLFDQVIIRPSLIDNFNDSSLSIIECTTNNDLTKSKYKPNTDVSDHFPIYFEIN